MRTANLERRVGLRGDLRPGAVGASRGPTWAGGWLGGAADGDLRVMFSPDVGVLGERRPPDGDGVTFTVLGMPPDGDGVTFTC